MTVFFPLESLRLWITSTPRLFRRMQSLLEVVFEFIVSLFVVKTSWSPFLTYWLSSSFFKSVDSIHDLSFVLVYRTFCDDELFLFLFLYFPFNLYHLIFSTSWMYLQLDGLVRRWKKDCQKLFFDILNYYEDFRLSRNDKISYDQISSEFRCWIVCQLVGE